MMITIQALFTAVACSAPGCRRVGILSHPRNPPPVAACRQWLVNLSAAGRRVLVPEIADYEVRRELIRPGSQNALINLDQLAPQLEYLPLTTAATRLAAA